MSTTPDLVGGGGGSSFSTGAVGKVKSVNLRSGKYIDSIQLSYTTSHYVYPPYGGDGGVPGSFTADVTLPANEVIVGVEVLYGKYIDNLRFITNKGKATSFGGNGKDTYNDQVRYYPVEAKKCEFRAPPGTHLVGMQGRSGKYLDAFAPIWGTNP
jgi:hypothetical protein